MNEIRIQTIVTGPLQERCYLIGREGRDDCAVIDPGADAPRIAARVGERRIAAILLTHCHFDHIGAAAALRGEGTEIVIHRLDAAGLTDPVINASLGMMGRPMTAPRATRLVEDGDTLDVAGVRFQVLHTPGHTAGGVCYLCEEAGVIFTGDTVLCGTCGRTDLPTGSEAQMEASLDRLEPLLRKYRYYGGH